jgi:hypothetical protein
VPPESPDAQGLPSSVPGSRPVSGAVVPAGVQPTAIPVTPALPAGVPPTVGLTPRLVQAPVPGGIALPTGQGAADWNRLFPGLAKALRPTQLGPGSGPVVDPPDVHPPKPVTAMSGSTPMSTDPGTAGLLRDYVNGHDAPAGQLDFGSTPVDEAHRTSLVDREGGDAGKVDTTIHDLGGVNPNVTQTPILLRNDKGQFGTATLFQVKGADGQTHLVDAQGAKYTDFNNYLQNNELDDSWTIVHPAHLGAPADNPQQLVSGPAHVTTFWGHVGKIGDKIAGPAMIVGGAVGVVGSATLGALGAVPSAGADVVPAIEGVTASAALVSDGAALYSAGRSTADLFNRYEHGRSINPTDPQAFNDYLNTLAAGAGVIRATRGLTEGGLRGPGENPNPEPGLSPPASPADTQPGTSLQPVGDFQNDQLAFQHYSKHAKGTALGKNGTAKAVDGPDVPEFSTFQQYRAAARSFMGGAPGEGSIEAIRPGGDLVRFNSKTGYFGIRSPQGVIRTFFRPKDGIQYYYKQFAAK